MGTLIDLTGERFGRLRVLGRAGSDLQNKPTWRCVCDCGAEVVVRGLSLRSGHTESCGCYCREVHTKHGDEGSRLYVIWCDMKERCFLPSHKSFADYGGRGITVCEEWLDYATFMEWALENGYDPEAVKWTCTLDRIDHEKGYCPENCRWVDMKAQGRNKRNNVLIEFRGEIRPLSEWAEILGVKYQTLYARLTRYNLSVEAAFTKGICEGR